MKKMMMTMVFMLTVMVNANAQMVGYDAWMWRQQQEINALSNYMAQQYYNIVNSAPMVPVTPMVPVVPMPYVNTSPTYVAPVAPSTPSNRPENNYSSQRNSSGKICRSCKGDGKCLGCHGDGVRTDNHFGTGKDYSKKCGVCGGNGICGVCRGTGHQN